ncbi:MAG: hypothetical protein LIP05_06775 [Tannerellaceae bacterium]|nr:hypothetical protein [Tannerellaceae bacterium]
MIKFYAYNIESGMEAAAIGAGAVPDKCSLCSCQFLVEEDGHFAACQIVNLPPPADCIRVGLTGN